MKRELIFPTLIITLQVCASVVWFSRGDVRRGFYWLAASIINISVTF